MRHFHLVFRSGGRNLRVLHRCHLEWALGAASSQPEGPKPSLVGKLHRPPLRIRGTRIGRVLQQHQSALGFLGQICQPDTVAERRAHRAEMWQFTNRGKARAKRPQIDERNQQETEQQRECLVGGADFRIETGQHHHEQSPGHHHPRPRQTPPQAVARARKSIGKGDRKS